MKKVIEHLLREYNETEVKLWDEIAKLPNFNDECNCEEPVAMDFIYQGDWKEIQTFCLNCGGYIEGR